MILLCHILFAAAIVFGIKNPFLAVLLAYLSHYLLDLLPHVEYPINNLKTKNLKKAFSDILYIILDFTLGLLLVSILSDKTYLIFIVSFAAVLPDILTVFSFLLPNKILKLHDTFHRKKVHFLKHKPISNFWRILSQVAIVIISVIILR